MRSEERRVGKECRSRCDWSSDVCSSDLTLVVPSATDQLITCLGTRLSAASLACAASRAVSPNAQERTVAIVVDDGDGGVRRWPKPRAAASGGCCSKW